MRTDKEIVLDPACKGLARRFLPKDASEEAVNELPYTLRSQSTTGSNVTNCTPEIEKMPLEDLIAVTLTRAQWRLVLFLLRDEFPPSIQPYEFPLIEKRICTALRDSLKRCAAATPREGNA